jgi:hypothetical protein
MRREEERPQRELLGQVPPDSSHPYPYGHPSSRGVRASDFLEAMQGASERSGSVPALGPWGYPDR